LFEDNMKARCRSALLIASLSFTCCAAQAATNLVDNLLAGGRFQQDTRDVRAKLRSSIESAALVVKATVVNSNTAVQASPKQREVSTGQGWSAALCQTAYVFKGDPKAGLLWVANGAFRSGPAGLEWRRPVETINGQQCILVLEKDKTLSRWCQTNVFAIIRGLEVR
jgi:hypothetical protein